MKQHVEGAAGLDTENLANLIQLLINVKRYTTGKTAAGRLAAISQLFTETPKQSEDVRPFTVRQEQLSHSTPGGSINIDDTLGAATLYKCKTSPQIAETLESKADAGAGNAFAYQLALTEKEQTQDDGRQERRKRYC